jgi:dTDP-4-dehydrorhamnose 3,5-epimerase
VHFAETAIPGVIVVEPTVHRDERGFFLESWHLERYRAHGIPDTFVQDNHSRSARGVLRGLHAQSPGWQGKLVRCIAGTVWDVAVDVRLGSPTWGRHVALELSAQGFQQIYVPPGCLHGFVVTGESAEVEYKCTLPYDAAADFGVRWNDPELAIPWPVAQPVLSGKDRSAPLLRDVRDRLLRWGEPAAR